MNLTKHTFFVLLGILFLTTLSAQKKVANQYAKIDSLVAGISPEQGKSIQGLADFIKSNFDNDNDRVRAIFVWLAFNIEYDMNNMFKVDIHEKQRDKILKTMETRKGVCDNYSLLFDTLCSSIGVKSRVILGYTKQNNVVDNYPHAWNAAFIDNKWYTFDPTWGAGGARDGKFVKQLNNKYFKVDPTEMIKTHMPFDYLWQFLEYPVNTNEFYAGESKGNKVRGAFDYTESINTFNRQSDNERLKSIANRVEKNGVKNLMTVEYLKNIKIEIENNKMRLITDQYNIAIDNYNSGIKLFNEFINYRNNKFNPQKEDSEIQQMLDIPMDKLNTAKKQLLEVKSMEGSAGLSVDALLKSNDDALNVVMEQQEWLKSYLKKNKLARKMMFQKVSWFGIPLN